MLTHGVRFGPYEIVAKLGAGGMGEVWRARDSRLDRDVAIKVLPADLAADPERHARFEREAKVLASLNHPNIAVLYGLEHLNGQHALVMELVEGEGLDAVISRGRVPTAEAMPIVLQIAAALEAAHEKGIVHRDLKPANVKVRPDGTVKVLDFGLAKAFAPEAPGAAAADLAHSPTLSGPATRAGIVLGTAAYMSPEQARGLAVDKRSDIWSFGVVLYEMLTGVRPFTGELLTDLLANVLKQPIDFTALPDGTPSAIRQLLRHCLERDPRSRLHDIADGRIAIDDMLRGDDTTPAAVGGGPSAARVRPRRVAAGWLAITLALGAVAIVVAARMGSRAGAPRQPMHLSLRLGPDQELPSERTGPLTFSPDGRSLMISGLQGGRQALLRRALGEPEARLVAGTEGAFWTAFSPDGRWLAFTDGSTLRKVAVEGGRPFDLAEAHPGLGVTWLHDDTLVWSPVYSDGLFRVLAEGGRSERLTTPDHAGGELGHCWPEVLPGDRKVIFTSFRAPVDSSRIGLLDLATRQVRWVVNGSYFGRYVASGHLLFARGHRLFAVPFDAERGAVTGPAVAVVDDLFVSQTGGFAVFAVSSQGTLAYMSGAEGDPPSELVWVDRSGRTQPAMAERRRYQSVQLSPDGGQVAVSILDESSDLWLYSLGRGTLSRLTSSPEMEFDAVWSTDGRELFFVVDTPLFVLSRMLATGADPWRPIWKETPTLDDTHIAVAPDGRWAVFVRTSERTGHDLYARPLDGSEAARPFRATKADEASPCFSPDGRWIAYQSDETGRPEIYVEAFPGPGERVQVSADGGTEPVWTRGSREIFFRHDNEVRVAATHLGERLGVDTPRTLFSLSFLHSGPDGARAYDVAPDGSRLLVLRVPEASVSRQIEIVTDWASQLPRLAPAVKP